MTKVLIIEDDTFISELYKVVFSKRGYEPIIAKDGEEGFLKVQELRPRIVLLDIMMPKMNGLEMLQKLKKETDLQGISIIVLTNLSESTIENQILEAGALKYLIKSRYTPDQIVDIVQETIAEGEKKPI